MLFRHAKSAWPEVADHERPLARRGQRDAPVMGRWLHDAGLAPDRVLCSTARRARETWQLAQTGLGTAPPVTFEPGIYEGAAADLLALIQQVPSATTTLLVIGHNPAIEDLAFMLAAAGPGEEASSGPHAATKVTAYGGTSVGTSKARGRVTAAQHLRGLPWAVVADATRRWIPPSRAFSPRGYLPPGRWVLLSSSLRRQDVRSR